MLWMRHHMCTGAVKEGGAGGCCVVRAGATAAVFRFSRLGRTQMQRNIHNTVYTFAGSRMQAGALRSSKTGRVYLGKPWTSPPVSPGPAAQLGAAVVHSCT
jgi:hypothetical protein